MSIKATFYRLSIREKLLVMIMSANVAVILLTFTAVSAITFSVFNDVRKTKLQVLGDVIASNVEAALAFDDKEAAIEALMSLEAEPHVVSAAIYDAEGRPFAAYNNNTDALDLSKYSALADQFNAVGFTHTLQPVMLEGRLIGFVYLRSENSEMVTLFGKFLLSGFVIVILITWTGFAIAARLQKVISKPVSDLTHLTTRVSNEKNFALRAEKRSGDELGILTERFNEMLAEIEQGEAALLKSNQSLVQSNLELKQAERKLGKLNDELEAKVKERTAIAEERAFKLRELALSITSIEEKERKRLAKVLHDYLQQILVAIKIDLSRFAHNLDAPNREECVARLVRLLDESIEMSRTLAVELSPPILQTTGLLPALEWLGRWFEERHHLNIKLVYDNKSETIADGMSEEIKTFLFNAVRELLFNIVKHSGVSLGEVRLSAEKGLTRIEVCDEGNGFDPKILRGSSQGFGLFNIQERIGLLGGSLDIRSRPGGGSCFAVVVPTEPATAAKNAPKDVDGTAASGGMPRGKQKTRVLVVDDHRVLREGVMRMLADSKDIIVVGEAADGAEAVKKAMQLDPDIIIMDINMPHMNGIDATKKIKIENPKIKVVSLSIHSPEDMAETMRQAGSDAYHCKSEPLEDLVQTIRGL